MLLPDKDIAAILMLYRKINAWRSEHAAPLGLNSSHVSIIIETCKNSGISQNEMVKRLSYEKSVVAKAIAKLIAAGYITREQNAKDKRAFNLFPTEKAWDVYPTLIQQGDLCMELLTDGLTMEERAELSLLLEKMVQNTLTKLPLSKSK